LVEVADHQLRLTAAGRRIFNTEVSSSDGCVDADGDAALGVKHEVTQLGRRVEWQIRASGWLE
jgi:hypothetical protein